MSIDKITLAAKIADSIDLSIDPDFAMEMFDFKDDELYTEVKRALLMNRNFAFYDILKYMLRMSALTCQRCHLFCRLENVNFRALMRRYFDQACRELRLSHIIKPAFVNYVFEHYGKI